MIQIIKPGLLSTVQDLGRINYLPQAVTVSGAMDTLSACVANLAIGNPATAAVLEFTYSGAEFITAQDVLLAISGEGCLLQCGDQQLPANRPLFIPLGTILKLVHNGDGCRMYLALAGGVDVPEVLGSRSTYLLGGIGGLQGRALHKNDSLKGSMNQTPLSQAIFKSLQGDRIGYPEWSIAKSLFLPADRKTIRIIPCREQSWFEPASVATLLAESFKLSHRSNRMGIFLEGPGMKRILSDELISTAVCPGTIQVSGDGTLIILMVDCQTTGGYPRIAQVVSVDLPLCGQLKPGDSIRFKEIPIEDAEMLYLQHANEMENLIETIRKRYGIH